MLRTESRGVGGAAAAVVTGAMSRASVIAVYSPLSSPAQAGDPVFQRRSCSTEKPRRTGSPPARGMTTCCGRRPCPTPHLPSQPFRLTRQFDGLDLLQLDGALDHHVVQITVGGAGHLGAIEIDLGGWAMILFGPG